MFCLYIMSNISIQILDMGVFLFYKTQEFDDAITHCSDRDACDVLYNQQPPQPQAGFTEDSSPAEKKGRKGRPGLVKSH